MRVERRLLELSITVPPLPLALLPFPRQRHGRRTCTDRAGWERRGHCALRRGPGRRAGLPHPCASSAFSPAPSGGAGQLSWGRGGKASRSQLGESLAAGRCGQHVRCGFEQTAPNLGAWAAGEGRGIELGTCLSLPSRPGRPGEERCCRCCSSARVALLSPQRGDREGNDGNGNGEEETSRARIWADEGAPGRGGSAGRG